ncbi:MAG: PAS domain-containing protein [Parvularculaceae bacterium]|nr:PAS domain-containing protein [Parvularculaceae bacterium]
METFQSRVGDLLMILAATGLLISVGTKLAGLDVIFAVAGLCSVITFASSTILFRYRAMEQIQYTNRLREEADNQTRQSAQRTAELVAALDNTEHGAKHLAEVFLTTWSLQPVIALNGEGKIAMVSAAAERMFGEDLYRQLGRRMDSVFQWSDQEFSPEMVTDGSERTGRLTARFGSENCLGYRLILDGDAGAEQGLTLVLHDVSEVDAKAAELAHITAAIESLATPIEITDPQGNAIVESAGFAALPLDVRGQVPDATDISRFKQENGSHIRLWHDQAERLTLEQNLELASPASRTLVFSNSGNAVAVGDAIQPLISLEAAELSLSDLDTPRVSVTAALREAALDHSPVPVLLELAGQRHLALASSDGDNTKLCVLADFGGVMKAIEGLAISDLPYAVVRSDVGGCIESFSAKAVEYLGNGGEQLLGSLASEQIDMPPGRDSTWIEGAQGQAILVQSFTDDQSEKGPTTTFILSDLSPLKKQFDELAGELQETRGLLPAELMIDDEGLVIRITQSAEAFLRPGGNLASGTVTEGEKLIGQPLEAILSEEAQEVIASGQEVLTTGGRSYRFVRIGTIEGHELIRIEDISPFIVIKRISEVQRLNDISATITPDGIIDSVSDKYLELLGRAREDLIGTPISEIFDDMFVRTGGFEEYWSSLQTGKPGQARLERKLPNGDKVYVAAQHTPIYGNKDEIVCFLETLYDTSVYQEERRVSQQGQRDLLMKQRKILEDLSNGLGAVTRGDYSVKLPDDVPDDYLILKEDFDAAVVSLADAQERQRVVKEQQEHVVRTLAEALASLADGKLDRSIGETFPEEYESLRIDFNNAVERLHMVMSVIANTSEMLDEVSSDIKESTNQLSQRTESQTVTLEQTTQSFDQLTTHVGSTAERAKAASNNADTVLQEAHTSQKIVQNAVDAMELIESSSVQVSAILSVIDDIAFQTNLLALNAGVEAARAGESGRGFAVVAQEVRSLAQRSADSAREIKALITTSSEQVSEGVHLVNQAGEAIESILERVEVVSGEINTIASSASEQAEGISEINKAVSQIDQLTKENLVMAEENANTGSNLGEAANELIDQVAHFKLSGRAAASKAPAPGPKPVELPTEPKPAEAVIPPQKVVPQFDGSAALAQDDWTEF